MAAIVSYTTSGTTSDTAGETVFYDDTIANSDTTCRIGNRPTANEMRRRRLRRAHRMNKRQPRIWCESWLEQGRPVATCRGPPSDATGRGRTGEDGVWPRSPKPNQCETHRVL